MAGVGPERVAVVSGPNLAREIAVRQPTATVVAWMEGIVLSAGSVVGGYFGVLASNLPKAKIWAFRLLVVTISIELIHLGWQYWVEYRPAVESWL